MGLKSAMNKVIIDKSPLSSGHAGRGIGAYVRGLETGLAEVETDLEITFGDPKQDKYDLVHYPYFDIFARSLPLWKKSLIMVTIHDLIPLKYPKLFPAGIRGNLNWQIQKQLLKSVDHVVTDSQASKLDILELTDFPEEKISIVYLAAEARFTPRPDKVGKSFRKRHNLQDNLLGYVGDINFNKNLPALIRAVGKVENVHLAIVTRADLESKIPEALAIKLAINDSQIGSRIQVLKLKSADELVEFYSALSWYVQPSIDEGFGLPVLEAMQTGTPVISAKGGSLPEVVGEAGIYFDPHDVDDIAEKIHQALGMTEKQRKKYIQQGLSQSKRFTWRKTAEEMVGIYNRNLISNF